ncbi:MAG TPA: hypothetical protein VF463_19395 [Sphingobium sp.]
MENPVAAEHPRPHSILNLLRILLTLMLGNARQKMLNDNAVGVRAKLDGWRFQRRTRAEDRLFQIKVIADVTRHAAYIVDDDDQPSVTSGFADESQHVVEAGTLSQLAGHIVGEHTDNLMAAMLRICRLAPPPDSRTAIARGASILPLIVVFSLWATEARMLENGGPFL